MKVRSPWFRAALFLLLILGAGWVGWKGLRAYGHASVLRSLAAGWAAQMEPGGEGPDVPALRGQAADAREAAVGLQAEFRPFRPLADRLGWVPRFGPVFESAGPAIDYAAGLTIAADEVLTVFDSLLLEDSSAGGPEGSPGERLLAALVAGDAHLQAAEQALEQARLARAQLSLEDLPESLAGPLRRLDPLLPHAAPAVEALRQLPNALGQERAVNYLILAQNQDELRATGGFITGVGRLTLARGALAGMSIGDSYAVDDLSKPYPPPPEPLQRYMQAGVWLVRDANWSPDFPSSARTALDLYALSTGTVADGVVAFDQTTIERILAVLGPVELPNVDQPISADNVVAFMRQSWGAKPGEEADPDWWPHRKDFMADLGEALMERALASNAPEELLDLAQAGYKLLREKHLLVYFVDPRLQSVLQSLGLDGGLQPGDADFLMVVDSNVGFNKVDPLIERDVTYRADLTDPGKPTASLLLHYTHTYSDPLPCVHGAIVTEAEYQDLQRRCYWDYFRVIVPGGSVPVSARAPAVPAQWLLTGEAEAGDVLVEAGEAGTAVFAGIFVLPPRGEARVRIDYGLPPGVLTRRPDQTLLYTLHIAKQAGTMGTPVRVEVRPPAGTRPDSSAWEAVADGWFRWEGRLWVDETLSLVLLPAGASEAP